MDRLVDLLLDAAKEMHLYAEKCLLVYHDFNATDAQIETELDKQANKIEKRVTYEVG